MDNRRIAPKNPILDPDVRWGPPDIETPHWLPYLEADGLGFEFLAAHDLGSRAAAELAEASTSGSAKVAF
jgi:hypothetical protein